jgi:hypothetical protein
MICRRRQLIILSSAALIVCSAYAHAEVQKFLNPCGGQKLCASYALVLTPPDGFIVDPKATAENKVQIMVPKGQSFASAEPLIYVQVFYQPDKQQTLVDFARSSNARWLAANPRAKITKLPAVERKRQARLPALCLRKYRQGAAGLRSRRARGRFRQGRQRFRARCGDGRQQHGGTGSRRRRLHRVPQGALSGCAGSRALSFINGMYFAGNA